MIGLLVFETLVVAIVGGTPVPMCGWPTTVYSGGCTATLVHPRAISTAQHCGQPTSIQFGEQAGSGPSVGVLGCVGDGSQDAMLCELAEEVTGVPVTPVLFGCEVDNFLTVGAPVVLAGFGQTSYGVGGGTKYWAEQTIASVEQGRVIVGEAGDGTSPCPGDSGGPAFVQVGDGSWRVFGTVLGGTTGVPCNSAADFQRIDAVVANFEAATGLDITPCFDGATGAWDPGADCGGFFAGGEAGQGSWDDWCEGTSASSDSDECGPAYGDGGDDDDDGDPDAGDDGAMDDAADDGVDDGGSGGADDGGDDGNGDNAEAGDDDCDDDCDGDETGGDGVPALPPYDRPESTGCSVGSQDGPCGDPPLTLALLLLGAYFRRR